MSNLPYDLVFNILKKLPVKTLVRFKGVCKSWRYTIESRQFIKEHFDHHHHQIHDHQPTDKIILRTNLLDGSRSFRVYYVYYMVDPWFYVEDDEGGDGDGEGNKSSRLVTTLGLPPKGGRYWDFALCSCDGLLLVAYKKALLVWNPCTGISKLIPNPKPDCVMLSKYIAVYGFGYDASIDDYKIVIMFQDQSSNSDHGICVFTLKTNTWRSVAAASTVIGSVYRLCDRGTAVFLNGSIHFRARRDDEIVIVGFILAEERMVQVSPFPHYKLYHSDPMLLGGKLSLSPSSIDSANSEEFEIWSLMDYSDSKSWVKVVSFTYKSKHSFYCRFQPICITENGNVLLGLDRRELLLYDKQKQTLREVIKDSMIDGFPIAMSDSVPLMYTESLVSPLQPVG